MTSTSRSTRAWSVSIFRNTSPTRSVARSEWATTTSISGMPWIIAAGHRERSEYAGAHV